MKYKQASKNFTHSSYLKTVVTPKPINPMPKVLNLKPIKVN